MAAKNLFEVDVVVHNDAGSGENAISYNTVFVLARTPSQVSSKLMKSLGDKLLFIESIRFTATDDESVLENSFNVKQFVQ